MLAGLLLLGGAALLPLSAGAAAPLPTPNRPSTPVGAVALAAPSGSVVVAPPVPAGPGAHRVGPVSPELPMNVLVALAGQNATAEAARIAAEYTPGSPLYHDYLPAAQFAGRFGAPPGALASAVRYFDGFGLDATALGGGTLVEVQGSAGEVARAFGTSFDLYAAPGGRSFVGHPTAAVLPAGIPWTGAVGLGNASVAEPLAAARPPPVPLGGPLASCAGSYGLSPCQIAGAYNASGLVANGTNGTGERIGIVDVYDGAEPQTRLAADLAAFDSTFQLPNASVSYNYPVRTNQSLNGTSTGWGVEEALDLEWAHAMAPGASIAMTFGTDSNAGLYEAVDWLVAGARANVVSLSWGENDVGLYNAYAGGCSVACNASTDGSYEVLGPVLAAAALEGITVLAASGDCGSADGTSGVSTNYPASDPYVTGVGGTSLTVSGAGVYGGEVGWSGNSTGASSPGCQNQGGSGGGYAPFPRPWWQSGSGLPGTPATRGVPDVAADASTGAEVYYRGSPTAVGGTSLATPIWAGFVAVADQYAGASWGFLDPALYGILRGSNYTVDFHDIRSGSNGYSAGTGWDPVTGIGTPRLDRLVRDLVRTARQPSSLGVALTATPLTGPAPHTATFALYPFGGSGAFPLEGIYFGDGNATLAANGSAAHRYAADGVYPAVGWVVDSSGNTSVSDPVAVVVGGSDLSVSLRASITDPAAGASVSFSAAVVGGVAPYDYLFAFGDGTYANVSGSAAAAHAYATAGGYCADVVVTDSARPEDGGTSTEVAIGVGGAAAPACPNQTAPLSVRVGPTPAVRDAPADFPSPFGVVGGSGGITGERFGSTDPYVGACQCLIFRSPGTYSLSLTVTDGLGEVASNSTNVTVAPALTARFAVSTAAGPAPLAVAFSAVASGGYDASAAATTWSFGDGGSATGAQVFHTFDLPGQYVAVADLEDRGYGNASEAFVIDVLPAGSTGPSVTATIVPAVNVTAGATVHFAAASSDPTATFQWDLGNGAGAFGSSVNATLAPPPLTTERARSIRLVVDFGSNGSAAPPPWTVGYNASEFFAVEQNGFLPQTTGLWLAADAGPPTGTAPLAVSGSAVASGPGAPSVGWRAANGTETAGGRFSTTLVRPGNFTLWAVAGDAWNDSAAIPFAEAVAAPPTPLAVRASVSPLFGPLPLGVAGRANATGGAAPYAYRWTFGDGGSAYGTPVLHTYAAVGTYSVRLTVTDAGGANVTATWAVLVAPEPSPHGTSSPGPPADVTGYLAAAVAAAAVGAIAAVGAMRRRRPPATP